VVEEEKPWGKEKNNYLKKEILSIFLLKGGHNSFLSYFCGGKHEKRRMGGKLFLFFSFFPP